MYVHVEDYRWSQQIILGYYFGNPEFLHLIWAKLGFITVNPINKPKNWVPPFIGALEIILNGPFYVIFFFHL